MISESQPLHHPKGSSIPLMISIYRETVPLLLSEPPKILDLSHGADRRTKLILIEIAITRVFHILLLLLLLSSVLVKGSADSCLESAINMSVKSISRMGFPWVTADPFLFCVYHRDHFPSAYADTMGPDPQLLAGRHIGSDFVPSGSPPWRMYHGETIPGFPAHPHCGFETITIVTEGTCDHGRFGGHGDTQWMTAGAGVQHCEMFPLINKDKPNPLELFQIWLNLPRASKAAAPHYKMIWDDELGHSDPSEGVHVTVFAGSFSGVNASTLPPPDSWAHDPLHDVAIWLVEMEPGSSFDLPAARLGTNRRVYLFAGQSITIDGTVLNSDHTAALQSDIGVHVVNTGERCRFLLLQGQPIGEPVAQRGPFVANTQAEIAQAFQEYRRTQFGGWSGPADPTHPRDAGRFAKHGDGTLVRK